MLHDVGPDGEGDGAAVAAVHDSLWLVETGPDAAGETWGVAAEPGVVIIIGGAGLTGGLGFEAQAPRSCSGASGSHHALEHPIDLGGKTGGDDVELLLAAFIDEASVAVDDAIDYVGAFDDAVVGEDTEGSGECFDRSSQVADEELGGALDGGGEARAFGEVENIIDPCAVADSYGHGVPGSD